MQKLKTHFLDTQLPDKQAFAIEVPEDYPKLHTLSIVNGKRGGGKTVCTVNYLKKCRDEGLIDKIYVCTPTYHSNSEIWRMCYLEEKDCYQPSVTVLQEFMDDMETHKEEWTDYEAEMILYREYLKYMEDPAHQISEDKLLLFYQHGYNDEPYMEKPVWKWEKEGEEPHPPRFAIVLDDCLNSDVMRKPTAGLVNFCIRHRHICGGLGCSVFMLTQSYCSRGGVDRAIRENTTHLYLFRICDQNQIKKIFEECDLPIEYEEFEEMLKIAHSEPFNFLHIDFCPSDPLKKYRNGWNEYLVPASLAAEVQSGIVE
jgi:hypothetical protein